MLAGHLDVMCSGAKCSIEHSPSTNTVRLSLKNEEGDVVCLYMGVKDAAALGLALTAASANLPAGPEGPQKEEIRH